MPTPPGKSVFVSYCHTSQPFVRRDLVRVRRAAGAGQVFVNHERFTTGRHITGQMDHFQDQAYVTLAPVTPDYLASTNCLREWSRAVGKDPAFALGSTIPVRLQPCTLPANIVPPAGPALYANLTDPADPAAWDAISRESRALPILPACLT